VELPQLYYFGEIRNSPLGVIIAMILEPDQFAETVGSSILGQLSAGAQESKKQRVESGASSNFAFCHARQEFLERFD